MAIKIDDKDKGILDILINNARTSYTDIAETLRITEGTVRNRISRMEAEGVIKRYTVEIDPSKLGYKLVTILGIDTAPESFLEVANEVAKYPEAKWVATSSGDHMIMVELWAKDGQELSKTLTEKIGKIKGVKKLCPAILLEKIKS